MADTKPQRSHFSLNIINLCLKGFFEGGFGLRGSSKMILFFKDFISNISERFINFFTNIPCYNTIKNWVLKLGIYKLERLKEQSEKWTYIIDKTIQMGPDKCLVIIGVRLDNLDPDNLILSHKDIEPIIVKIIQSSNGEIVFDALKEARNKTGGYCQIISDGGSDIVRGTRIFDSDANIHFYDITHKLALLIKNTFEKKSLWASFVRNATQFTQKIKMSPIGHLAPS